MDHPFTDNEMLTIFEAARISLEEAETFHHLRDKMDIEFDELSEIETKLKNWMNEKS